MFKHDGRKRSSGGPFGFIFTLIRMLLSLGIMAILILGVYQAYRSFSGVDPLKLSPQSIAKNFLSSDEAYKLITGILSAKPEDSLTKAKDILSKNPPENSNTSNSISTPSAPLAYKFAIIADSHTDNTRLKKALEQAKSQNAKFVIGLGDYTNVGTQDELKNAKQTLDVSGLPYYVTAGDHDLWDARDKSLAASKNFSDVFGATYTSFGYQDTRFLLIYNADNYLGLDSAQLSWIDSQLESLKQNKPKTLFVMLGIPLYHPSSDHVMGKVTPKLKDQADHLIKTFADSGVNEVFAGDAHFFSRYKEPKFNLPMTVVGAVTAERNPQNPRFVMVDVYDDGSYNVEDLEIQ